MKAIPLIFFAYLLIFIDIKVGVNAVLVPITQQLDALMVDNAEILKKMDKFFCGASYPFDASFGSGGKSFSQISDSLSPVSARAVAVQNDQKIVVVGIANNNFFTARYRSDGGLDTTFGGSGYVITNLGAGNEAKAVVIQSNQMILAVGNAQVAGNTDMAAVRYTTNGDLDASFGSSGIKTIALSVNSDTAQSALVLSSGRIILGGNSNGKVAIVGLTVNGQLDSGFGVGGKLLPVVQAFGEQINSMALQADGKIVAAGISSTGNAVTYDWLILRFTSDGVMDPGFGISGHQLTDVGGTNDGISAVVIHPTTQYIIATGLVGIIGTSGTFRYVTARYTPSGNIDTSFGTSGKVVTNVSSGDSEAYSIILQGEKILVTGLTKKTGGAYRFGIVRYNSNGDLDLSFGDHGKYVFFGRDGDNTYSFLAVQGSKIIFIGNHASPDNFILTRLCA